ncbi:hypothetical protein Pla86_12040 [Planctomycetes bacterium Pla86]|uniref:DUF403 domain-containing protein n=2 Tax=Engelhardtia mirabilis TaxID=2528011 RepID=A0A518BGM2_9BACT|nr:hypothetical protein Pla133_12040 [Planctomycetes bacterium Pla133]QDV00465.1 hypothetical protein Pla86_12040 [Planctomycetes bacterium Pla86]
MLRYLERADNTAGAIGVNLSHVLDSGGGVAESWEPVLVVTGEMPRFRERFGEGAASDGELVQRYLTWDEENPASIISSIRAARDNARTIRETISREMWESVNLIWLWLQGPGSKRSYDVDRSDFFEALERSIQGFRGTAPDTMLHEEPLDFMRLGMQLERAGMTSRILDVRYHMEAVADADESTVVDFGPWHAILRSCSGIEAFLKRGRSFSGKNIATFLVGDPAFPRSILHCIERAEHALSRILAEEVGSTVLMPQRNTPRMLGQLRAMVSSLEVADMREGELHEALTRVIDSLAEVCNAVHVEFFDFDEASLSAPESPQ